MKFTVAILGGGFAGWTLQNTLQSMGLPAKEIIVLEQALNGRGSSGVLRGMMHPFTGRSLFPRPGYLEAWHFSRNWFAALQAQSRLTLYHEMPLWRVALTSAAARQFARSFARARENVPDYPLQQTPLPEGLAEGVLAAYGMSPALQVNLPLLVTQLANSSQAQRQLRSGAPQLFYQKGHWCIQTKTDLWRSEHLVFACGQDLKTYFPDLPLSRKRGEVAIARCRHNLPGMLSGSGMYIAPLGPEHLITGATFYHGERPWSPVQSWRSLSQRLAWLPALQEAQPQQIWSGVRAVVQPDREALLGPVPSLAQAWVMAGFGTRGLLQIPLAAQTLAATLLNNHGISDALKADRLAPAAWRFNPTPGQG
ncbi:MAG: FAD-binding oxidoreductase [Candidatus Sericytochromatia bacterium]|nr:FAD-binding oxidoreductase [Candidatus Sericytochromatia bacterium]